MYEILLLGYEFLSEFVPFLVVLMWLRYKKGKFTATYSKAHYILPVVFALYIMAVFHITGVGTVYDAMTVEFEEMKERINLIPFSQEIDVIGYLLNIVMFVPFGFLVPLIWKEMGKLSHILTTGFALSLLIELSQLFSYRGTDVDDIILNTLGAVVGFLVYRVWDKATRSRFQLEGLKFSELPAYILALYLGRFLLFHQVGLIDLIYGF